MPIVTIGGKPRAGKNLTAVYMAKKHYQQENGFIRRFIRKKRGLEEIYNNVYSNFPILLDRDKDLYCEIVCVNDLKGQYSFRKNALIIIDEMQMTYDSMEYQLFPKTIASFMQTHGHYYIDNIVLISQHPRRIPNKPREIAEILWRIKSFKKFPFLPIGFLRATQYYEFEDYGKSDKIDKDYATYEFDIVRKICLVKDLYGRYDTHYLWPLNKEKPLIARGTYHSLYMTREDIYHNFGVR